MIDLKDFHVAILATDGFEETELTEPMSALKDAGALVTVVSLKSGKIQGMRGDKDKTILVHVERLMGELRTDEFDAVHLPGGTINADTLRMEEGVQRFLREMDAAGKPIAAICHAPWELVSAGLVAGRTLTSYYTIQDDIRNAGGNWVDQEVVVDGNWVTSRQPSDIPSFNPAMLELFAHSRVGNRA